MVNAKWPCHNLIKIIGREEETMRWENTIMKDNTNQCHIVQHIN